MIQTMFLKAAYVHLHTIYLSLLKICIVLVIVLIKLKKLLIQELFQSCLEVNLRGSNQLISGCKITGSSNYQDPLSSLGIVIMPPAIGMSNTFPLYDTITLCFTAQSLSPLEKLN